MRLVALTGSTTDEYRARSRGAGFDAHLAKPVSAELLRAALLTFLR
jgi:CheY-like chemotaxis protein